MGTGLSRFAADLPAVQEFVSLGEGDTPVLALPTLARRLGLQVLWAKMESLNPTGSYKDRVAAMSLSLARQHGAHGWIATSSGNAGLSFAAYGARAGLPGFLCMVASAPAEKRAALMPYDIGVAPVDGIGTGGSGNAVITLMDLVREAAVKHGLYLGITANAYNPDGMRGIETIGYELVEQLPDATHVYVPAGGGGLLTSLMRGLARRGASTRAVVVQPTGCAPIARFVEGELPAPVVDHCDTIISALQLPSPPDGQEAAAAVVQSAGWGTTVSDEEILAAQRSLATAEGVFVEPASAAGLAGLIRDVECGRVQHSDQAVLVLTGAGWKDLGRYSLAAEKVSTVPLAEVAGRVAGWAALPSEGKRVAS